MWSDICIKLVEQLIDGVFIPECGNRVQSAMERGFWTAGVNFINILRAHFSSFLYFEFGFEQTFVRKICAKNFDEIDHRMLVWQRGWKDILRFVIRQEILMKPSNILYSNEKRQISESERDVIKIFFEPILDSSFAPFIDFTI